jgi:hypothetical protein
LTVLGYCIAFAEGFFKSLQAPLRTTLAVQLMSDRKVRPTKSDMAGLAGLGDGFDVKLFLFGFDGDSVTERDEAP